MRCSCPIFYTSLSAALAGKSDNLPGRQVSEGAEGSFPIVESSPRFHLLLSVIQGQEPVFIQALLAEPPIEVLDEGVVLGLQPTAEVQGQRCTAEPTKLDKIKSLHSTDSINTENSGTRGRSIWVNSRLLDSSVPAGEGGAVRNGVARSLGTEPG